MTNTPETARATAPRKATSSAPTMPSAAAGKERKSLDQRIEEAAEQLRRLQELKRKAERAQRERNEREVRELLKAEKLDELPVAAWRAALPQIRACLSASKA